MDTLRLVTLDSAGAATEVANFNDGTYAAIMSGTFKTAPSSRRQLVSASNRRYGGGRVVGEQHDNGTLGFSVVIRDSSPTASVSRWEALIGKLELATADLFVEWRPEGATSSVFYEARGPATWEAKYEWVKFVANRQVVVDVTIPIAPLGRGVPVTFSIGAVTQPGVFQIPGTVGGTAPALLDLTVQMAGNSSVYGPMFGLVGWSKRPSSGLAAAPYGLFDATTAVPFGYTVSGTKLVVTTSGAGVAIGSWYVDPSLLVRDAFTQGEVLVEVWAEIGLDTAVTTPTLAASISSSDGINFGKPRYTHEFGNAGKSIYSSFSAPGTTVRRMVRVGTVPMPTTPQAKYILGITASWGAGSSGHFDLNRVCLVPIKQRACTPTGFTYDTNTSGSAYPAFIVPMLIKGGSTVVKTIRSDLSGLITNSSNGKVYADAGLGGSVMELPPGNVDLLLYLSNQIPDDPSGTDLTAPSPYNVTVTGTITPRYFLANPT